MELRRTFLPGERQHPGYLTYDTVKAIIAIFAIWVLGSIVAFATAGTKYITPYALITVALFALTVWLANKKNQPPAAGLNSFTLSGRMEILAPENS